jgi:hypothetical protein
MTTLNIRLTVETDDTAPAMLATLVADAMADLDIEVVGAPIVSEKGARGRKENPSTTKARELILKLQPGRTFTASDIKAAVQEIETPTLWALLAKLVNARHLDKVNEDGKVTFRRIKSPRTPINVAGVELDFTNVDKYKEN